MVVSAQRKPAENPVDTPKTLTLRRQPSIERYIFVPSERQRPKLFAVLITLVVHGAAAWTLWKLTSETPVHQPPRPIEVTLMAPPPLPPPPVALPEPPPPPPDAPPPEPEPSPPPDSPPPPPDEEPPPPPPEPLALAEEPPPPELEPPEPEPPPPEPPPPPPKEVKKRVVKPPKPVKRVETVKEPETPPPVATIAPQEPVSAPIDLPVQAPIFDAAYLRNPIPPYPASARRLHLEGTVVLRVLVGRDGTAQQVSVRKSSGAQVLDEVALNAVRDWTFVPAKQGNRAVVATVDVPVNFNLK